MRFVRYVAIGIVAVVILAVAGYRVAYESALANLRSGSEIAETSMGPIEYARTGKGPAVAIVHGTPGGYDQFRTLAGVIANAGYEVIVYSRPGYLHTPITVGETVQEQADALAALLTFLDVKNVAVVGISGGGPSAVRFAIDYPERTTALMLVAALSGNLPPASASDPPQQPFGLSDDFRYLLAYWFPERFMLRLGVPEDLPADARISEAVRIGTAKDLFGSLGFSALRNDGYLNDTKQFYRTNLQLPVDEIRSPALMIYGELDTSVPEANGQYIVDRAAGPVRNIVVAKASHTLFVTHVETVTLLLVDFLRCPQATSC